MEHRSSFRGQKHQKRHYLANEQLMQMISQVFQNRESGLIQQTIDELMQQKRLAMKDNIDASTLQRLPKK